MPRNSGRSLRLTALIEDRRARVASYKVRGLTLRQTVDALTDEGLVNPSTHKPWDVNIIAKDVQMLVAQWQTDSRGDITEAVSKELATLDEIEREAWSAWGISQRFIIPSRTKLKNNEQMESSELVNIAKEIRTSGDPRFLTVILDCQQKRAKLLGLDAPTRIEQTGRDGGPIEHKQAFDLSTLSLAELDTLLPLVIKLESGARDEDSVKH